MYGSLLMIIGYFYVIEYTVVQKINCTVMYMLRFIDWSFIMSQTLNEIMLVVVFFFN